MLSRNRFVCRRFLLHICANLAPWGKGAIIWHLFQTSHETRPTGYCDVFSETRMVTLTFSGYEQLLPNAGGQLWVPPPRVAYTLGKDLKRFFNRRAKFQTKYITRSVFEIRCSQEATIQLFKHEWRSSRAPLSPSTRSRPYFGRLHVRWCVLTRGKMERF